MKKPKVKIAKGPMKWYLNMRDAFAAYAAWNVIYFRNERVMKSVVGKKILAHELKHWEQKNREGLLMFGIKYVWWSLTRGYVMNPYEIEARKAMGQKSIEDYQKFRSKYNYLKR